MAVPVVLIPGAGGAAWYWHLVEQALRQRGHDPFAVELPAAAADLGLPAYADVVVDAVGPRTDIAIVAQSMGGFTAPLVWQRVPTKLVVFVNAMIPIPGETPGAWGDHVGSDQARIAAAGQGGYGTEFDLDTYFLHDIPPALVAVMMQEAKPEAEAAFGDPCTFDAWPDIPIRVVAGRDDRFFPLALQQRVARDRLGVEPDVVPGGHLCALSHPTELAGLIDGYLAALDGD